MGMFFLQISEELGKSTANELSKALNGLDKLEMIGIAFIPKVVSAVLMCFIGLWLIKWVNTLFLNVLRRRKIEASLQSFLSSLIRVGLYVLLALTVISVLGVNITGFAALLAGAGLAIGSALNGSLGNFAGGVMILLLKPFRVGDLIEAQGQFGIVKEIGIVYTSILTSQNKTIRLPNGTLSTGVVNNYTDQENLRIDIKVPIADYTNVDKASEIAIEAMKTIPEVISDPAPTVRVAELTGDGPILVLWPRIKVKPYNPSVPRQMEADYYAVYFGVRRAVYDAFILNDIPTPSNTLEVTMMGNRNPHQGFD